MARWMEPLLPTVGGPAYLPTRIKWKAMQEDAQHRSSASALQHPDANVRPAHLPTLYLFFLYLQLPFFKIHFC